VAVNAFVNSIVVSDDGTYLFSGAQLIHGNLIQWRISDGSVIKNFEGFSFKLSYKEGHTGAVLVVKLFDGILFSGSFDTRVIKWNIETAKVVMTYIGS
jgi:WD40 repeat protein